MNQTRSTTPRRTSSRLAALSNTHDTSASNIPSALEVVVPARKQSTTRGSSRSSLGDVSGDGTRSTPATSVAITPAESDVNKPNKRVNASARARALRESTRHSVPAQNKRKRSSPGFTQTDVDEALARHLQAQEYDGVKRQKASPDEDIESEDVQSDLTDGLSAFEEPYDDEEEFQRTRPRDKYGKKIRYVPQIILGESSEEENSTDYTDHSHSGVDSGVDSGDDSPLMPVDEDVLRFPKPSRNATGSRGREGRGGRGRRRRRGRGSRQLSMARKPVGMSNRVSK